MTTNDTPTGRSICYVTSNDYDDAMIDIALAEGCEVRFRADAYGEDLAREGTCPCCGRDGGMQWVRSMVPGVWDMFGCDYCGHMFGVEAHVAEAMGECAAWQCKRPATRAAAMPVYVRDWDQRGLRVFALRADEERCCSAKCADDVGDGIAQEMCDEESLYQTERSLMGRL